MKAAAMCCAVSFVARAATAYKTWRATEYKTRTALLSAIADQFDANRQRLAQIGAARGIVAIVNDGVAERGDRLVIAAEPAQHRRQHADGEQRGQQRGQHPLHVQQ